MPQVLLLFDAPPFLRVPAASGEEEAGARGEEKKHLRHALESETRPKGAGLDRRDDIGGKSARRETEIEHAIGKNAPLAAEPRGRRHDELEPHLVAVKFAHLGAEVREPVDQAKLERLLPAPEL